MAENDDDEFRKFLSDGEKDDSSDNDFCSCSVSTDELILKVVETKTDSLLKMIGICLDGYTHEGADEEIKDSLHTRIEAALNLFTDSIHTYDYLISKLIDESEKEDEEE